MDKDRIEKLIEKKVEEKLEERQEPKESADSKIENLIDKKINNTEKEKNSQEEQENISRRSFIKTLGLGATGMALTSAVGAAQWYSFGGGSSNSFSGDHKDLTNVSSADHHSRYTDNEARIAVDGANIDINGDAITIEGRKIYTQSTAPTGASAGDIWIDTS